MIRLGMRRGPGLVAAVGLAVGCGSVERAPAGDPAARRSAPGAVIADAAPVAPGFDPAIAAAPTAAADAGVEDRCAGRPGLRVPVDPGQAGPWPVGVRSVRLAGLSAQVWYPAVPGSQDGQTAVRYDLRDQLPRAQRDRIPDSDRPLLACDCYRDLPLDTGGAPFPVVVFVHGYTLFGIQSVTLTRHWASRGFVVIAPDLPGATLAGSQTRSARRGGEVDRVRALLDALGDGRLGPALPAGALDTGHLALVGHSLGGAVVARLGGRPGVDVVVSIAEGGIEPAGRRFRSLVIGGNRDAVEEYAQQVEGYAGTPRPRRLVGLAGAGHMAASDLCATDFYTQIRRHQVKLSGFAARMVRRGCADGTLPLQRGWQVIAYATSAALEEPLDCPGGSAEALAGIGKRFPAEVAEYREDL